MGSYSYLMVEKLEVISIKSDVFGIELFQPSDKRPPTVDDDGVVVCEYRSPVINVLDRLSAMGYTLEAAREGFNQYRELLRDSIIRLSESLDKETSQSSLNYVENFNFEKWQKTLKSLFHYERVDPDYERYFYPPYEVKVELDYLTNGFVEGASFGIVGDVFTSLFAILDLVDDKQKTELILSYGDVASAGYIDANEQLCDPGLIEKIVVLTEGVSDQRYIQRSMKLMCPHIFDFYSFLDFEELKIAGSASTLVHTIKAFSAAGIRNKIVAVFDNDTAAASARKPLKGLPLPANIRVISLPDLDFLTSYPTLGPQGPHQMDVNGLAGSIELYFEESTLRQDDGSLMPIVWKGYDESLKKYQGEISNKATVQAKFEKILNDAENGINTEKYNFNSMRAVLTSICGFNFYSRF